MASRPSATSVSSALRRECFVTVGATASFRSLIDKVLASEFIDTLADLGYTHLNMQYGPDGSYANEKARLLEEYTKSKGIKLRGFDFNKVGLGSEMRHCKGINGKTLEGVVVCHAGAGTILDAMRLDVPIIVVPNPTLLDNHQVELAEELERQGYVCYGDLEDLPLALRKIERDSLMKKNWRPKDSGADPTGRGVNGIMDEEVGFELSAREILD